MEHTKDMSTHRYNQAVQCLQSAKFLLDLGDYKGAANRSYYGIFHAIRSIMALDNVDFGNHGQVIGYFRRKYIKTNIFPKDMSRTIDTLFKVRNKCDYDDFYVIGKEDVFNQLKSAELFLIEIEKYLKL